MVLKEFIECPDFATQCGSSSETAMGRGSFPKLAASACLRYYREQAGFTQRYVSDFLGTTLYSYYEDGAMDLPFRYVFDLAQLYQVSTSDLCNDLLFFVYY